jgi:cytochrome P450 family 110
MATTFSLPPGPRAPAALQTLRYVRNPLPFMDECHRRYGEAFTIRMVGLGSWVFLSNPADLKTFFTAPPDVLHGGEINRAVFGPVAGTTASFVIDGETHLRRRRLLVGPFHSERMPVYGEIMQRVCSEVIAGWRSDAPLPLHPQLQRIAFEVILAAVFGLDLKAGEKNELKQLLIRLADEAVGSALLLLPALRHDLGAWSPWGKVLRVIEAADAALLAEIARRRGSQNDSLRDILSLLLALRDEDGRPLSDQELRDELVTMLSAGHETTATSLAWAFECVLSRPKVLERIDAELEGVEDFGTAKLEYLDAVIKESMRLRPIFPNGGGRISKAPFEIAGHTLPRGTVITNCNYLVARRLDLYPAPDEFRPERFLGRQPPPFDWTPFGGGARRCLGAGFALYEMRVVLATVLSQARLRIVGGPVRAQRRGYFLAPSGGLPVVVSKTRRGVPRAVA